MAENNACRKKEAKRMAGPSGQKEKQRKEAESSERTKNGSRRGGRKKARKARLQPTQVQEPKTQGEESTMCVGVLHVSSRAEWTCHMIECTKPYHALRECDFSSIPLSEGENEKGEEPEALRGLPHLRALYAG